MMARVRELSYSRAFSSIMRLAIVAASSYEENGQVAPIPNAEVDVELFGRRLGEPAKVGKPETANRSLIDVGTPCSEPVREPAAKAAQPSDLSTVRSRLAS